MIGEIVLLGALLVISGFFSGSEVALVSLSRHRVAAMLDHKKFGSAYIFRLKQDPNRMLATILIGNNLVNIAAASITTAIFIELFESWAIGLSTGIMTLLILIIGEITPKAIANQNAERVSQFVAGPIWYLSVFLAPIVIVLDKFLNWLLKAFGLKNGRRKTTEEDILTIVRDAEQEGSIKTIEKKLIHNVLKFDDAKVEDILTPRTRMVMIRSGSTIKDIKKLMIQKKFSRIPVFKDHRDNILGIVYDKDILGVDMESQIDKIMRRPFLVPETKSISVLLRDFQKRREQMAIVIDEHGSVIGLVTLEDILEEIVGEIRDETEMVRQNFIKENQDAWIVDGATEVEEINAKFGMKLSDEEYDTFAGYITHLIGHIPKVGDSAKANNFKFTVLALEGNRVSKVRLETIR